MYRCEDCRKVSKPGEECHIVVRETRNHVFPVRLNAHRYKRNGKEEIRDDPGGHGKQIVREARICGRCMDKSA